MQATLAFLVKRSSLYANLNQSYYKWNKRDHHMNIKLYIMHKLDKHMVGVSTVQTSQSLTRYPIQFNNIQSNFDFSIKKNKEQQHKR